MAFQQLINNHRVAIHESGIKGWSKALVIDGVKCGEFSDIDSALHKAEELCKYPAEIEMSGYFRSVSDEQMREKILCDFERALMYKIKHTAYDEKANTETFALTSFEAEYWRRFEKELVRKHGNIHI